MEIAPSVNNIFAVGSTLAKEMKWKKVVANESSPFVSLLFNINIVEHS